MSEEVQVSVKDVGPCRKQLKITVSPERIQREIHQGFQTARQHVNLPGFRRGKVPQNILEKKFGPAIRKEVKESLVQDTYREAVEEKKLALIGAPEINLDSILFSEEKPLEYQLEVDVRPEIELKNYKGVKVKRNPIKVETKEVEEHFAEVRKSRRRPEADENAAVSDDNFAVCAVEFFHDNESVLKRDAVRLSAATPVVGTDPKEFQKTITGKKKNEEIRVPVAFPEDFEVEAVRGKKGQVAVTPTKVYKFIEPTDEELLKQFDFETREAFHAEIEKNIRQHKEEMENRRLEQEILGKIIETNDFELPERIVKDQAESALNRFRSLKEAEGLKGEALEKEVKKKKDEIEKQSVAEVKGFFLTEAIARVEKLFVTEDDMKGELKGIAERNQVPLEEVFNYYQAQNLLPTLRLDLMERKVRGFLRENAAVSG